MKVEVSADGAGLVSHAGSGLLAGVADRVGLTAGLSRELAGLRERRGGHDPGRVVRDLAVMLADGGDCLADLRAVRDQACLFGTIDLDATLLTAHSDKEGAAGNFRGGYGFHPMLAYCEQTRESMGGLAAPGERRREHRG